MSEGYGFWGKILKINLSSLKYKVISLEEKNLRNYFLGSGLAALLFYKEYFDNFINYPALHSKNPLIILSGLFTGTMTPTACKVNFCGKSPLTGIWNESTVGG
ncbi:MAG: aldehyde ferredoxin oxidoreductase, partial [Armatimonadetes bacterium]|nr:aldehyde ferredoxin oxidoreductase [Armatimonadota bacterium]